jgi:uncharacterized membrane protein YciS (DUF1049 family)
VIVENYGYCREEVYWPFPYVILSFLSFLVILASEILTKTESRFKESFIAFLCIPEIMAWCTLIVFMYFRIGAIGPTALAAFALIIYIMINFVHACVHPRKMVPNSLFSYKQLFSKYKCSTYLLVTVSYIVSFKFSLILVSYFWLRPRLKGDYSASNWLQFNKFSFAFLVLPYPMMMVSCGYFLMTDGMFSYAGFVAVEVIAISSILAVLMMLDAVTVLKCRARTAEKIKNIKVNSGDDNESDFDLTTKRILMKGRRQRNEIDEFGADEAESFEQPTRTRKGPTSVVDS